ncbi:hypothetical protein BpHYR1_047017 [Brachionus plicatilis]|uniref:Uncharacterized protein n=1 Tax=Brachionus plicatilis TaxID=10195 RepID=A0A3M7RR15_BRAPC|nr:hypothetical protein BpHYR1_047017 [Brachionus plicatilis]
MKLDGFVMNPYKLKKLAVDSGFKSILKRPQPNDSNDLIKIANWFFDLTANNQLTFDLFY